MHININRERERERGEHSRTVGGAEGSRRWWWSSRGEEEALANYRKRSLAVLPWVKGRGGARGVVPFARDVAERRGGWLQWRCEEVVFTVLLGGCRRERRACWQRKRKRGWRSRGLGTTDDAG